MRRAPLLAKRSATRILPLITAARPTLTLRPSMGPAMGLAEEFSDGRVAVRGEPMHAVARLDRFRIDGRFSIRCDIARYP